MKAKNRCILKVEWSEGSELSGHGLYSDLLTSKDKRKLEVTANKVDVYRKYKVGLKWR